MGTGKKRGAHSQSGNGHGAARNLSKDNLGGAIFGCKDNTMGECLSKQLFGLPSSHFQFVRNIEPGMPLFLFNYTGRTMHGIYEAATPGEMNIDPYAWTNNGNEKTAFPAQVRIHIRAQCQPITENQFEKVIGDNYYRQQKPRLFWFELDRAQTEGLIALFLASDLSRNAMIEPAASSDANLLKTLAATKCNLLTNFDSVHSGIVEPMRVDEFPPVNPKDKCMKHDRMGTTRATTTCEMEYIEPSSYRDNRIEGNLGFGPAGFIIRGEGESRAFLEQQFRSESLETGQVRGQMIETPPVGPNCSTMLHNTYMDYHIPYIPRDINEQSMFPWNSSVSAEKINGINSNLDNGNTELVQIVKELKERAAALEKKQFESELEIQRLRNVVKDSGEEIHQLKGCVTELESKIMRSVRPENVIYLIGGFNGKSWLSALDSFSPSMDILMPLKPMGAARSYASAAALNGNFYVFGGGNGSSWFNTVECYSQRNDNWTLCPPLIRPKGSLAGATLNGKIFALGGGNGTDCFSDVEMFDPALGRWIYNQSMLQKRFAPAAVELHDVLYATGGFDGQDYLQTAERWDPRVGYWTKVANMKSRRGCHSMATFNDKLYAMGGFDGENMVSSMEIFDPRNELWMEGEPLNLTRGYSAAAVLGGSLFVIGGVDDSNDIVEKIECYGEGSGWTICPHTSIGKRCFFSAIVP